MGIPVQFPSEVAQRILNLLEDGAQVLFGDDYQVLYGDQNRVGVTPTVCVEAGATSRSLAGAPSRTENILTTYIIIYWAKVDSNQKTKLDAEQCAESVARYLDRNLILERGGDGGIVIHGFVSSIEPGYSFKGQSTSRTLYYSVRLTWTGKTKTILGA
jgi:hypothetical protein